MDVSFKSVQDRGHTGEAEDTLRSCTDNQSRNIVPNSYFARILSQFRPGAESQYYHFLKYQYIIANLVSNSC